MTVDVSTDQTGSCLSGLPGHDELGCALVDELWAHDKRALAEAGIQMRAAQATITQMGSDLMRVTTERDAALEQATIISELLTDTETALAAVAGHQLTVDILGGLLDQTIVDVHRTATGHTRGPIPTTWMTYLTNPNHTDAVTVIRARVRDALLDALTDLHEQYRTDRTGDLAA